MPTKILVIGLDAFEKSLLLRWARSGDLPNLGALLGKATWGTAEGPPGLYAGAVWPSFSTGVSPAHHRRFFRRQTRLGEYLDVEFKPTETEGAQFWEHLSAAGRRVAVLDVPHAKPSGEALNGIQLVDWTAHEPEFGPGLTVPAALAAELTARFGKEVPDFCDFTAPTVAAYTHLKQHLENRIRLKTAIATDFLKTQDWDLFLAVFGEAHCAGHHWWHLHDADHPDHDPHMAAALDAPLKAVYTALDRSIGEVIDAAGPDARILVLGSHGMGPQNNESVVLDEILKRLERAERPTRTSLFSRLKSAWYLLPRQVRGLPLLRIAKRRMQRGLQTSLLVPERQSRRCFTIPYNAHAGAIRFNVVGREAHGIVQPGADYQALCRQLREALMALVDPHTGEPIVAEVYASAECYSGPYLDELPDLLVEWRRSGPVRAMASPRIGTIQVPPMRGRTGDHTREGFFIATGPGEPAGELTRTLPIVDFTATIAAVLGVDHARYEGQPVPELLAGLRG